MGQRFAVTIGDAAHIGDLYALDAASHTLTQLTHVNDSLWSALRVPAPERITYRSFDGTPIEAWVYKPPDFEAGKRYPLILNIHGGPHAAYGETFFHEAAVMAARGYVVLTPNPRGSTSYGEHFGNIIQYRYPGDDYRDLMIGVDTLDRARVHRPTADGRDGRERGRPADELGRGSYPPVRGGRVDAVDRRLGGVVVQRRFHAVYARRGSARRRSGIRRTTRGGRRSPISSR